MDLPCRTLRPSLDHEDDSQDGHVVSNGCLELGQVHHEACVAFEQERRAISIRDDGTDRYRQTLPKCNRTGACFARLNRRGLVQSINREPSLMAGA